MGFMNGRSTTTQLLRYFDECVKIISDGGVVDSIYLDFWKAFDTVPHQRLLGKLESYGITGKILNWIKEFLVGRSQQVQLNGVRSKEGAVTSGIPQGFVLGPILFIIYTSTIYLMILTLSRYYLQMTRRYIEKLHVKKMHYSYRETSSYLKHGQRSGNSSLMPRNATS